MDKTFYCYLYLLLLSNIGHAQRKPGECPKPLPIPVCEKTCFNDQRCSGTAKCCRTDCNGSVCLESYRPQPVMLRNKPGSCPARLDVQECHVTCREDSHCSRDAKCCKTDCNGAVCTDPVFNLPTGGKPGHCPKTLNLPICDTMCLMDDDCAGDGKCCQTDCKGAVCIQPIMETVTELAVAHRKPGKCPGRLNIPVCTATCEGDHECAGESKCCMTNCYGYVCTDPILEPVRPPSQKPGSCPARLKLPICSKTCGDDYSCAGDNKCCATECNGSVCVRSLAEVPTPPPIDNAKKECPAKPTGPWVCTSTCSTDNDCRGSRKCCKNRCGAYVCTKLS